MADKRIETVTGMLKQMRDLSSQMYSLLAPEIMSYEMIRGDLQRKKDEMKKIDDQKQVALIEIEDAKQTAESIKNMAKDEAEVIIQSGKNVMMDRISKANKLLETVESFVPEMDKKRYMAMRKESDELSGKKKQEKLAEKAA